MGGACPKSAQRAPPLGRWWQAPAMQGCNGWCAGHGSISPTMPAPRPLPNILRLRMCTAGTHTYMSGRLRVAPGGKSWAAGVRTCSAIHGRSASRPARGPRLAQRGERSWQALQGPAASSASWKRTRSRGVCFCRAMRAVDAVPPIVALAALRERKHPGVMGQPSARKATCTAFCFTRQLPALENPPATHQYPCRHSPRPLHWFKQTDS